MKLFAAALSLALGACAGAVPGNPQGFAGLTHVEASWEVSDGKVFLRSFKWIDGKEKKDVSFVANVATGDISYRASGVLALGAFTSRAEVESFVADRFASTAPDLKSGLVELLVKMFGL